ncbi:hypothetical protein AGABI1DRAFT_117447 [Agaricus bisporus var. burnettii JB137-S8]|uniref:SMP-LTD domain-containing protein n=1 Tax=Agaricus bisporus var. burnettii (strain JB137-S8 / ATCC MYA-4627 / FGSC 10392) TaxID=597362 RepID=K5X7U7_AGABU|nr:uncharacterized protein AGABI1DRAFT_117447 [Agaricus bisporus var. burnettii JB137-S8]EKM83991.1 hypothetical protein AGABI1DRAFT_117447 [Agaricus bisporus var. burnettii JB137-S8]
MLKALVYAYVLGGLTFIPLCLLSFFLIAVYTSVPVGDIDPAKKRRGELEQKASGVDRAEGLEEPDDTSSFRETNDVPKTKKGWLTMRHSFEESPGDGGYVNLVRAFLDSRSKDPKKSRPKDMWYVVLKGKVLYLYEDEDMTEINTVIELGSHDVVVYPEGQMDGEMFAKRNAICLKAKDTSIGEDVPNAVNEESSGDDLLDFVSEISHSNVGHREKQKVKLTESEKGQGVVENEEPSTSNSWFIFVRSNIEMEDWYLALLHASEFPAQTPTLSPLQAVFRTVDMDRLISTLDEQPDVIPMRWLNALVGRLFFSYYRTRTLESIIIGRLMKKLSKVKRPAFLADVVVTEVCVGDKPPMFSKPMLKELSKEGDASVEIHLQYKGEIRITIEATAIINLGQFKSYNVKLVLAAVVKELEGNVLIKVKRPPSNRIWYAFTQSPKMVLQVEPIVSDRQIKWGMILSTIESKLREIIQESVVMPNMDDIAYFESSPYKFRGGIWSDARRSRSPVVVPGDSQTTVPLPSATASEPALAANVSPVGTQVDGVARHENDEYISNSVGPTGSGKGALVKEQPELTAFQKRSQSEPLSIDEQRGRSLKVHPVSQTSTGDSLPDINEPLDDSLDAFTLGPHPSQSRKSSAHSVRSHRSAKSTETAPETPTRPRKPSDASHEPSSNSSPSSFLSTLRSKAGDRQATARETMRKWGVNWSNLKKDFSSEENGDLTSKSRGKVEVTGKRSNYDEVRAAVSDRRERERSSRTDEDGGSSRSISPAPVADIPCKESVESASMASGLISHTSSKVFVAPFLTSRKSLPSLVKTDIDVASDVSEDDTRPIPIQAQPQAKTMTIPGIHASHRGEVMSMGYVAPSPSIVHDAAKSRNPAMQSVYRLWKNPANNGHENDVLPSIKQTETLSGVPEAQLELVQAVEAMPSSPPPPLPPRPGSDLFRADDRDQPTTDLTEAGSKGAVSDEGKVLLSEEVVLNSRSMPTSTTTTPPPLPPRHISSSA